MPTSAGPASTVNLDDVEAVIADQLTSGQADYYYSGLWNQLESEIDRRLLGALAEEEEPCRVSQIAVRLGETEAAVSAALERLEGLDILMDQATADGDKVWRFRVELMQRWLQQRPRGIAPTI